jgi:uncharacterized protein
VSQPDEAAEEGSEAPQVVTWDVETPVGTARVHHHPARIGGARATLVLGHGAGGGVEVRDLAAIAAALPAEGVEVLLVEQPWHVAGKKVSGSNAASDRAWVRCLADLRSRGIGGRRLVAGGRSTGARVACRTVGKVKPDALFLLAFPLQPPRRRLDLELELPPSRLHELVEAAATVPTVVVQGSRDQFGSADEIAVGLAEAGVGARVLPVAHADHGFKVPQRFEGGQAEALDLVVRAARATALRILDGQY